MTKKLLVYLALLAVVLAMSWRITQSRSLSIHFVDEEDHIVFASYMNQGLRLYKDLSTNHQALVYLGSSAIQKITKPQNILMLVKRHRQAVFFYSAVWGLILTLKFGVTGLIFIALFELLKFGLLGNLWLMETLAVYPAVYLFGALLRSGLKNKWPGKKESVFLGICSFLVAFNLVPLWPWLGLVWLVFWFKNKKNFKALMGSFLLATLLLFIIISPIDWLRETVVNNFVYAVPALSPIQSGWDWLKLVFFPFLSFFSLGSLQAKLIHFLFAGWLITLVYLLTQKSQKALWLAGGYIFLALANNRVLSPGAAFYHGFHLLPWLGLLLWLALTSFSLLLKAENKQVKLIVIAIIAVWGLPLLTYKDMSYFWQTDPKNEYYINYSQFEDLNFAIKALTEPGDRLAVLTNESLIYWNTGVKPATKQIVYYSWEKLVPDLGKDYKKVFSQNPPEFIYGGHEAELVKEKYIRVFKKGQPTELFIRKDKIKNITQEQWNQAALRGFEINYL